MWPMTIGPTPKVIKSQANFGGLNSSVLLFNVVLVSILSPSSPSLFIFFVSHYKWMKHNLQWDSTISIDPSAPIL